MRRVVVLDEQPVRSFYSFLQLCGIYMEKLRHYQIYSFLLVLLLLSGFWMMGTTIYLSIADIDLLATIGHHTILLIDVAVGLAIYTFKRSTLLRMLQEMRKTHDYESELVTEFLKKLEEAREKKMARALRVIKLSCVYMVSNLIVNGYVETYITNAKHMLLMPCWFPLNLDYLANHLLAYAWQLVVVLSITFMAFGVLALLYLTYSHIKNEFQLLQFTLEHAIDRAVELAHATPLKTNINMKYAYISSVRHCGQHHVEITKFFADAKSIYSYIYLAAFLTGLVIFVCAGFALTSDNTALKIKFFGITVIQMVLIFTLCWFGEEIAEESDRMRLVIYGIPWSEMPRECQTMLRLMIERSLRSLSLISASGHKADLDTFMSMTKASYSYFNMLLAAQGK